MTETIARPGGAPSEALEPGGHVFPPLRQPIRGDVPEEYDEADAEHDQRDPPDGVLLRVRVVRRLSLFPSGFFGLLGIRHLFFRHRMRLEE